MESIQPPDQNNDVTMLDRIPDVSKKIRSNLVMFAVSMIESFSTVDQETMNVIPLFREFRNRTVLDTLTYYKFVVPATRELLQKSTNFFESFTIDFEELEVFIENIGILIEDITEIKTGFEMCSKMHYKVAEQAQVRHVQAQTMMTELGEVNQQYKLEIEDLQEEAAKKEKEAIRLRQEGDKSLWNLVPIANFVHQSNYDSKVEEELSSAKWKTRSATKKQGQASKLFRLVYSLQESIIPALCHYIEALKQLGAIFVELANKTQDIKDQMDKCNTAQKQDMEKRVKMFHKGVMKRADILKGNLMSVVHIYDGVEADFKAMEKFQALEEGFSACLLAQIQELLQNEQTSILKDKPNSSIKKFLKKWTGSIVNQEIPQKMIEAEQKFTVDIEQTKGASLVQNTDTGFPFTFFSFFNKF